MRRAERLLDRATAGVVEVGGMLRRLCSDLPMQHLVVVVPSFRRDFRDLPVGRVRQAGEHIADVSKWIQTTPAAVFDEGVNDGAALPGIGIVDEEPGFLADGRRANGFAGEGSFGRVP